MKTREDVPPSYRPCTVARRAAAELAKGRRHTPISRRPFVRLQAAVPWRLLLVLLGLVVQVVLTVLMWQLVDLTVSLMEVWAELARKHLELTLS
jgi:hypothetical protein